MNASNVVPLALPRAPRKQYPSLSDAAVGRLPRREDAYYVRDGGAPGLVLRVAPAGVKSFRWYVHVEEIVDGKPTKRQLAVTLGRWAPTPTPGHLTVAEARQWLHRLKAAHRHSRAELERVKAQLDSELTPAPEVAPVSGPTVRALSVDFLKQLARQRKRPEAAEADFRRDVLPVLGEVAVVAVTPRDCAKVVELVVERGAAVQAAKVLGLLKRFFKFARARGYRETNPARDLEAAELGVEKHTAGRRALETEGELRAFWRACETGEAMEYSPPAEALRVALQLLLLTGVRSGELRQARWADVDLEAGLWTVPVEHQKLTVNQAKDARPFVIPLAPTAVALFRRLRELAGDAAHVLPLQRLRRAGVPAKGETIADKTLNKAMGRMWSGNPELSKLDEASPHDLRRTCRTWLGKLGVAPHVAERCLNHRLPLIQKTYDVGDYLEERRAALVKWDAFLVSVGAPKKSHLQV
ncbi:MAG: tyrosine-type recombinase/integrase [Deltaproteobacteria bacterium]|nr:tyrosine-type recombinase/integrase [Deltaproteobacteria bacterium]